MKKELKINAIENGTVIDHIPAKNAFKVAKILNLEKEENIVSVATNLKSAKFGKKCIIKVGGKSLTHEEVNKIAIVAPNATVNLIKGYVVKEKTHVHLPDYMENIIQCTNSNCITNSEKVKSKFHVVSKNPLKVRCHYCERVITDHIEMV
jgi:aspartate carbamoyltransferase regulatory subunit